MHWGELPLCFTICMVFARLLMLTRSERSVSHDNIPSLPQSTLVFNSASCWASKIRELVLDTQCMLSRVAVKFH